MGALAASERTWSTDGLPEAEQFPSWEAISCEAFCPVSVTREDDGAFTSHVAGRRVGAMSISTIRSAPQAVTRTAEQIKRRAGDEFFINLPLDRGTYARQDDRTARLAPGDFTIVDSTRPFELGFETSFRQLSVAVPHELLASRLASPSSATAVRVTGTTGVGAVASGALRALAAIGPIDRPATAELVDQLCCLVALAIGGVSMHPPSNSRALLTQAAFDEVERGLADPDLSPALVAARLSISSRYLHSMFADRGTTFGRWTLHRRLVHCHAALVDSAQAHRAIADVAFANGFRDPSYFARAFRARYGVTPRQLRAEQYMAVS